MTARGHRGPVPGLQAACFRRRRSQPKTAAPAQNSRKIRLMHQPLFRRYRSSLARLTVTAFACVLTAASIGAVGRNPEFRPGLDQARQTPSQQSGLPPLIDRELFFGNPEIASATISPDGKYIAFRKPWNDTMNIW